jgi:hypothetical protein
MAASVERKRALLGRELAAEVRRTVKPLGNEAVETYVKRVGGRLVAGLRERALEYCFETVAAGESAEPMVGPDGSVFVPRGCF